MILRRSMPVLLIVISCSVAISQTASDQAAATRKAELNLNRAKLAISVTLDRDVYFPNEDAQITIRVTNPTTQTMEVPEPFNPLTGGIAILRPGTGVSQGQWVYASSRIGGWGAVAVSPEPPPPPAVWLSPNQPKEKSFWLSESSCHEPDSFSAVCWMSEAEGQYRIAYEYDARAYAQFQVVWPQLEQWTRVKLQKPAQIPDVANPARKILTASRWVWFAAVGHQGNHWIIVGRHDGIGGPPDLDRTGKFTGQISRSFAPFRRIATSAAAVTSLQAVADNAENITVSYADQNGHVYRLKVNAKRDLAP